MPTPLFAFDDLTLCRFTVALIFDSKGFEKNDPEDKVGKPFIDWPKYGPKWNQGFPDYSTAGSCGPTSDEDVNLKGYPTQPVVDLFNRGFALHWGVEPRDVWDLVVYALDYISLKQKAKKDGLYMTYSKKDLIVMDLFAMLKIRVHSDEEYDAGNYDGVPALTCTGKTKDVLQQKAAHVETLYTKWTTLKQTCAAKYVVKGRLALKEVQDSLPAIGSDGVVDAGGGKKTKGTFKDNFASDLVYEHCLKVQLDYIRVLDGGVNKLGEGDCATNDGTYSCDPAGTFGQLLAWCASFSNEPYYSRGAVLHVVGTIQIGRKWQKSFAEQPELLLQTFTEHYGDVLKEIKHVDLVGLPAKIVEADLTGGVAPDLTATYEHVSKSAKYLHRMADAAVRLWAALSNVPGGSKADKVCGADGYDYTADNTDLPLLNVARAVTGRKTLDGIADLKTTGTCQDWIDDAMKNRAFWYVAANPRFDKLFNINVHKKGKYLDVVLKELKDGTKKFDLDLDRNDNPIKGSATVECAQGAYTTCGETLLKAIATGAGTGAVAAAKSHLEPKVHPYASTDGDGKRTAGAEFSRPDAVSAAITALIDEGAFSDQNFEANLREYFIKLQRQARSELEPRILQGAGDKSAANGFPVAARGGLADPKWTEHCTMVEKGLTSDPWTVDAGGPGDGTYKDGTFNFENLLEVEKGVPDACK